MVLILGMGQAYAQFEDFENSGGTVNVNRGSGSGSGNSDQRLIDRLRFGGSFGMGFASEMFAINVDPSVGYAFNKYVTAGITTTFEFYRHGDPYWGDTYKQMILGAGIYAEAYPIDFLVAHAEIQGLSFKDYFSDPYNPVRKSDGVILLGGGYHRSITDRAGINMMLLWNLNATQDIIHNTSFSNPIIRISFIF